MGSYLHIWHMGAICMSGMSGMSGMGAHQVLRGLLCSGLLLLLLLLRTLQLAALLANNCT